MNQINFKKCQSTLKLYKGEKMSINKELKFTKWYENHVVGKHEDAPYNYFMDDEWFDSLPNELKKSIIKVNEKSYDDKIVEYLWEYHDYYVEK